MLFFNVYYSENEDRKEAVVEFDAICVDSSYGLQNGTNEWIEDSLTCIEVLGRALKWEIVPGRCTYVSDYFENSKNWKDRWQECWHVTIWLEQKQDNFENRLDEFPRQGTNYIDATFDENASYLESGIPECNQRAFFVLDYQKETKESDGMSQKLYQIFKKTSYVDCFEITEREYPNQIIQCHIYITKKNLFPQEIKLLEQILDDLEEAGVVTNFQQRYSKLKVNFLETTASKEPKEDMPQHMTDIMKRLEELRKK